MGKMNNTTKKGFAGFSLIELMVVISIIAILMTIILGVYASAKSRRNEKKVRAELKALELAIHNFYTDNSYFPADNFDPDDPGGFDPEKNSLFKSLTQGLQEGKKNYLEGAQVKNDGAGNLVAPVDDPNDSGKPNRWRYVCSNWHGDPVPVGHDLMECKRNPDIYPGHHSIINNPESYDLWAPINLSGSILKVGNWEE